MLETRIARENEWVFLADDDIVFESNFYMIFFFNRRWYRGRFG
jgi:hypothetical protein